MYALECGQFNEIMSWSGDGRSFAIIDKDGFEDRVLPALFKPSKFESFIRKLCRWGFAKKRASSRYGQEESEQCVWFYHPNFQKGNIELCISVECRQNTKMESKSITLSNSSTAQSSSARAGSTSHSHVRTDASTIGSSMFHRNNAANLLSSNPSLYRTSASSQATSSNLGQKDSMSSLRQSSAPLPTQHTIKSLAAAAAIGMQGGQWLSHSDSRSGQGVAIPTHGLGMRNNSRGESPSLSDLIQQQQRFPEAGSNRNYTNATPSFGDSSQHNPSQRIHPGRTTSTISDTTSSSSYMPSDYTNVQGKIGQLQVDCSTLSQLCEVYKLSKMQQGDSIMPSCASTSSSGDGCGENNASNKTQWNPNGHSFAQQKNDLVRLKGMNFQQAQSQPPLPSSVNTKTPTIGRVGGDNPRQEFARLVADISNLTQMCELLRQSQDQLQQGDIGSPLNMNVRSQNLAMSQDQRQLEDGVSSYGGDFLSSALGSQDQSGSEYDI